MNTVLAVHIIAGIVYGVFTGVWYRGNVERSVIAYMMICSWCILGFLDLIASGDQMRPQLMMNSYMIVAAWAITLVITDRYNRVQDRKSVV